MILFLLSIEYNVNLSRESITVGEPIDITIQWEDTFSLSPSFHDTMMIEILDEVIKVKGKETKAVWKVTAYSPGEKTINFLRKGDTIPAVQVHFSVESVLSGEEKGIADVKPPMGMFNPLYLLWLVMIPLFLMAFLLRKGRKGRPVMEEEEVPPVVEALEALEGIKKVIEQDPKEFFTFLSEIFRRYIQRGFGIPAVEATTTEIAHHIRKRRVKELEECIDWMREWDLYKFTEMVPQKQRAEEYYEKVKEFLNASG